ncbi:MAG TPA: hypothetical protein VJV79_35590 [Polyangiaceae bacterium]|nr:hypothetical protein [Polyangiaceae bacterium]
MTPDAFGAAALRDIEPTDVPGRQRRHPGGPTYSGMGRQINAVVAHSSEARTRDDAT